jgi:tRNA dimethylallyltransferase
VAPSHARIPVIVGPTAGGKSDLAVDLALALHAQGQPAQVLAADAFQVYRGMNIGTAKPSLAERRGVPHHLIDLVDPEERFTSSQWLTLAHAAIAACRARGALPIVVGGTHLYAMLLLGGMFEGPSADETLRAQLRATGLPALREELQRVDPAAAARIHPNDERRTIRALEVYRLSGKPITEHQGQWSGAQDPPDDPFLLLALSWPIEPINRRINARVKAMMHAGLLDEVRALRPRLGVTAREALGYKQLLAHLEGRLSLEDSVERIKIETRRFAKNQRTWLKRLRATHTAIRIDMDDTPEARARALAAAMDATCNATRYPPHS